MEQEQSNKKRKFRRPINYITPEQFNKLYKTANDKRLKLAILLGFGAGLRISEIVGYKRNDGSEICPLTKENIDLDKHQIRIVDSKGNKWRVTIAPPSLKKEHLDLLPLKIPRRTLQYKFSKLCEKVIGRKLNFHSLRHGFGNYQANILKIPLPIVQSLLGHSRLDTTGIYTKINPEESIKLIWKELEQ
ncbi:MAG: tyrosine-type recombinase/integrase [Candidatus Pacearchaeota archaeon]